MLYILEAVIYQGVVQKYLFFSPFIPAGISIGLLILYRIHHTPPTVISILFSIITGFFTFTTTTMILLNLSIHTNFVYSTIHVNPIALIPLTLFIALCALISLSDTVKHPYRSFLLFLFPFWVYGLFYFQLLQNPAGFSSLTREDSLIEYATFLVYGVVAFWGFKAFSYIMRTTKFNDSYRWVYGLTYLGIVLVSLAIAGEEISWGQRILGFETPESLAVKNTQNEFNLHNHGEIFGHVYTAYALLGVYGSVMWIINKGLSSILPNHTVTSYLTHFTPPPSLVSYFSPITVLVVLREHYLSQELFNTAYLFTQWEEFTELILGIGIALFIYFSYRVLLSKKS